MLVPIVRKMFAGPVAPVEKRGYHVAYKDNQVNHCPGCGRSHWYIGRLSAECGFCGTALPLEGSVVSSTMYRSKGVPANVE